MASDLQQIYADQKKLVTLRGIAALLDWDEKTSMPEKGILNRAQQLTLVEGLSHDTLSSPALHAGLQRLKKKRLSRKDAIVLRELSKDVKRVRSQPKQLVEQLAHETTLASRSWQDARKKNSFPAFTPALQKVLALKKKQAQCLNPHVPAYDALLDLYEEGMTSEQLTAVFEPLKQGLVSLLSDILQSPEHQAYRKTSIVISRENQEKIVHDILAKMGIARDSVHLGISAHPFTTRIGEYDVRITTRYESHMDSFFSAVHEAGHALYELGYPKQFHDTVVYDAPSLGIHESQSRLWENLVCRSRDFWDGYFPFFSRHLQKKIPFDQFFAEINHVSPSFIRTDADEVTYCLHVILRFEIERDLMNGKLSLSRVPAAWNEKMRDLLGITPASDNQGVLQDVHWSMGAIGYFPTYALGTVYAAQLFKKFSDTQPGVKKMLQKQDFSPLRNWLAKNVHAKGRTLLADEIVKKATGSGLKQKVYTDYLKKKYQEIYDF